MNSLGQLTDIELGILVRFSYLFIYLAQQGKFSKDPLDV